MSKTTPKELSVIEFNYNRSCLFKMSSKELRILEIKIRSFDYEYITESTNAILENNYHE